MPAQLNGVQIRTTLRATLDDPPVAGAESLNVARSTVPSRMSVTATGAADQLWTQLPDQTRQPM
jgi:hypothetical protein